MNRIRVMLSKMFHLDEIVRQTLKEELFINSLSLKTNESNEKGITEKKYFNYPIIVSLTTFGKRINEVYLTIESIMQQTQKANIIILWLSEDEFSENILPTKLSKLQERGLKILYCKDIKSYKKLLPTTQMYPNSAIITIDDDVVYSDNLLENFIKSHNLNKNCILFNRGHEILFNKNGIIKNYMEWNWDIDDYHESFKNFPTGVGGVFYPPMSLHQDILNLDLIKLYCPTTDDIWFKAMTLKAGFKCKKCNGNSYFYELSSSANGLNNINIGQGQNDIQLKAVLEKYNLLEILKND